MKLGENTQAAAYTAAGMKACHQAALDGGSWRTAWLLTGLPEYLYAKRKFAGTEQETEILAAYLEAQNTLDTFAKKSGIKDNEDDPAAAAKKEAQAKAKAEKAEKAKKEREERARKKREEQESAGKGRKPPKDKDSE